jgi:hypothetical protein
MSLHLVHDDIVTPPQNLHATIAPDRLVEVRWDGTLRNTLYSVRRALPAQPDLFVLVGLVADTRFKDVSLPAGVTGATYVVQAHRDELDSDAAEPVMVRLDAAVAQRRAA